MGTRFKAGDFLDQFNQFNARNIRTYMQYLSASLYHRTDFKSLVPFLLVYFTTTGSITECFSTFFRERY
jgi:hypothetical protein